MRGWEHGADESPFLGQAGGGCGAGGAFLAGRAAGTNVFPTWPRICCAFVVYNSQMKLICDVPLVFHSLQLQLNNDIRK